MKKELEHFTLYPSVVKADEVSTVSIVGDGGYYSFFDDVEYSVKVCPAEIHDIPIDDDFTLGGYDFKVIKCYPKNGVIAFEYKFVSEQKWNIHISADSKQKEHLNSLRHKYEKYWDLEEMEKGKTFEIYSLFEDLYQRRVFVGDMHVHTHHSDGKDNPETVVANLRRAGYDYCAITDHHVFESSVVAKEKCQELDTSFTVFTGEEVHNKIAGRFHVVNFGGSESVNEKILSDPDGFKEKVNEFAKTIEGLNERDAQEVAWYKVITDEIRKTGGMSVFAHPFWTAKNTYNCPVNIAREVFQRGYFDAYEVLGGCTPFENNLEVALYYEMKQKGINIPVVGSTDIHDTFAWWNGNQKTVAFADDAENVSKAIMDGYSSAVEIIEKVQPKVFGDFRMVKYTIFLLENYFPKHDCLCAASGTLMLEYYKGDSEMAQAVALCEKKISEFEHSFFGK